VTLRAARRSGPLLRAISLFNSGERRDRLEDDLAHLRNALRACAEEIPRDLAALKNASTAPARSVRKSGHASSFEVTEWPHMGSSLPPTDPPRRSSCFPQCSPAARCVNNSVPSASRYALSECSRARKCTACMWSADDVELACLADVDPMLAAQLPAVVLAASSVKRALGLWPRKFAHTSSPFHLRSLPRYDGLRPRLHLISHDARRHPRVRARSW